MLPRHMQITIGLLLLGLLGSGVYMFQLRRQDIRTAQNAVDSRPVAAPVTGPKSKVILAIAYDDEQIIRNREVSMALPDEPNSRAREVLRALIAQYVSKPSPHPVGDGSDVTDVFFAGDGLCVVNLNTVFADGHRSGVLVEELTIASLAETLSQNMPEVKRIKFLVDSKDRETLAGHADLMAVYDAPAVHQMVAQLK